MLMVVIVLAVPTAIAVWLTERVDRPRRAAMRLADRQRHIQPAE